MKDKIIPEVVMSVLYSRYSEYKNEKILNSPFNDYERNVSVTLSYLKEVLEDIFGAEDK